MLDSLAYDDVVHIAKHLEPLKGGKVPLEILVRGKDPEQNAKQFEKCLDLIKGAGVGSSQIICFGKAHTVAEEGWHDRQRQFDWSLCR